MRLWGFASSSFRESCNGDYSRVRLQFENSGMHDFGIILMVFDDRTIMSVDGLHLNMPWPCKLCALPIRAFLGIFFTFFYRVTRVNHQLNAEIVISISDLLSEAHELVLIRTCFSLITVTKLLFYWWNSLLLWWQCISLLWCGLA